MVTACSVIASDLATMRQIFLEELLLVAADFSPECFKESQAKACGYQSI